MVATSTNKPAKGSRKAGVREKEGLVVSTTSRRRGA